MGLGQLLTRSAGPSVRAAGGGPGWFAPPRVLPQSVSERTALGVPAFWRGHALVCGGLGGLPVSAWRGIEELEPQPAVLRQPDPTQTPMGFWTGVASSLTLYGNSVNIIVDTDRLGYATALKPVHPLLAAVHQTGNPADPDIGGWYLAGQFYDVNEVWHVKSFLHRTGRPVGIGLLDGVMEGISGAQALQDYRTSFFASGAIPSGIIRVDRPEVGAKEAARLKSEWVQRFAGTQEPAVLNSLTDFTPIAYKPVDSEMLGAAELSVREIALMWGLPASQLGADAGSGTYRNVESDQQQAREAISPWARLLEQAIAIDLLPRGQTAKWKLDAYLRADTLTRFQAYAQALGGQPWLMVDEARALEGLDPLAHAVGDDLTTDLAAAGGHIPQVGSGAGGPAVANNGSSNGSR